MKRILSWHRARQARLHTQITPEPDLRTEMYALIEQQDKDIRDLRGDVRDVQAQVRLLNARLNLDDDILSIETEAMGVVMDRYAAGNPWGSK